MHLIVITSVIRPRNAPSVYSTDERFQQLLGSIRSARCKIVNSFIVVVEGTTYTDDQTKTVIEHGAHAILHVDVDAHDKQMGECILLGSFFGSDLFSNLRTNHNILSIAKLSGRYVLTDSFEFYYDGTTCICKISDPATTHSGHGLIDTRYYCFPMAYLDNFLQGLDKCYHDGIFINIEHSFYKYQAIPLDKINRDRQKINVAGCLAPDGLYMED